MVRFKSINSVLSLSFAQSICTRQVVFLSLLLWVSKAGAVVVIIFLQIVTVTGQVFTLFIRCTTLVVYVCFRKKNVNNIKWALQSYIRSSSSGHWALALPMYVLITVKIKSPAVSSIIDFILRWGWCTLVWMNALHHKLVLLMYILRMRKVSSHWAIITTCHHQHTTLPVAPLINHEPWKVRIWIKGHNPNEE